MHRTIESKYGKAVADEAIAYAKTGNTTRKIIPVGSGKLEVWSTNDLLMVVFEHSK